MNHIFINLLVRASGGYLLMILRGDIELQKYELCFSCVKLAEKYKVTDYYLRRFFDKLAKHKILVKKKRKIDPSNSQTVCRTVNRTVCRTGDPSVNPQFYTSITFCAWVFGENSGEQNRTQVKDQKIEPFVEPSVEPFVTHNKEVIKEEEKKEEKTNIYNAREKNFSSNQEGVKSCISVERIKKIDFPYAEEIMKSWIKYCSKRKELVMEELEKYCDLQICLQQTEMILPVFDYRFRGVLKRAFDVNYRFARIRCFVDSMFCWF